MTEQEKAILEITALRVEVQAYRNEIKYLSADQIETIAARIVRHADEIRSTITQAFVARDFDNLKSSANSSFLFRDCTKSRPINIPPLPANASPTDKMRYGRKYGMI